MTTTTTVPLSLSNLSTDILFYILSFQNLADTISFSLVCRTFNALSQERSLWIMALKRERLIRPIACTSYEDLSKHDLASLKRIAFHTLRLRHNWTRPGPQIKGVIRTVTLETGGRPFDLIFQVPATDLHVFHSRVTGEVMAWDVGIGKQVTPPVYVAKRVVDVSPGQEEEGKFSMGLLTSDSSWTSEGIIVICLEYDAAGVKLSATFRRILAPKYSTQYWAIFMTKEIVGALVCLTLDGETQRPADCIDVLAINLSSSRETLVKTDISSKIFVNAHSGTSTVGRDIFILIESHEKSRVFRVPAEYLPHEDNSDCPTTSILKCSENVSEVPWAPPQEGDTYVPEGALSANNFYGSPAVSLHAVQREADPHSLLLNITGMQIRFWGPDASTMPLTLQLKWVAEVQGVLQDSPDTAWKLMLLSHSGRKMLLVMNPGMANHALRLMLVTVDPESNSCLSHHLIMPSFIQLGYIYGLSLDDHRGVITLLDTRGYLFSIPYA